MAGGFGHLTTFTPLDMSELKQIHPTAKNGNTKNKSRRAPTIPMHERKVIAWDMEGISLSGEDKPQHPVLFGCSAESDKALLSERLYPFEMLEYIINVGKRYPQSIHIGYHFKYDANMILQGIGKTLFTQLWRNNVIKFKMNGKYWIIQYFNGKKFTITCNNKYGIARHDKTKERITVTIYDYSSFFGGSAFINAAENILKHDLTDEDRETIEHGKAARGQNTWEDIKEIRHYWEREIVLIERVFDKFRSVMYRAGFDLKEWYGPGALANYINAVQKIRPHLAGVQTTSENMPEIVHEYSKIAFSGGRFELFKIGRIKGPVWCVDINSAYPHALRMLPSFAPENGEWRYEQSPENIAKFGFYQVDYQSPNAHQIHYPPEPLFYRNRHGLISYPSMVSGVYASPEANMVNGMPGAKILNGWYWHEYDNSRESPWKFLEEMYDRRIRLGKENLLSMAFKLGPNSLYGKYAQTVGWDEKNNLPPKSHALPIAGWITSLCRSMLWKYISSAPQHVVGVQTDSIFLTCPPEEIGIVPDKTLGGWGVEKYDEMICLQSGIYLLKKDERWGSVKSRGIERGELNPDVVMNHLQSLKPGEPWPSFTIKSKPKFVGMGAALASKDNFNDVHCTWQIRDIEISVGEAGKRRHHPEFCVMCENGISPWEAAHPTFIWTDSYGNMSEPRRLPWEREHTAEVQEIRDNTKINDDMIVR